MRALQLLLLRDSEFRGSVAALRKADDDTLADQARKNIHRFLNDGDRTVTLHVDRTRGGYQAAGRPQRVGLPDDGVPDPIDRTQFDDAGRVPDVLAGQKPQPDHGPIPAASEESMELELEEDLF